jgi:hypothetical protein
MILPSKHIKLSSSLLGLGAEILPHISEPRTITSLWNDVRSQTQIKSFEQFSLCLDFLYALGAVGFKDGLLRRTAK